MNEHRTGFLALGSLVAIAVAAGVSWRLELESGPGWPGILWVHHTFQCVPVFAALFVVWASAVALAFCLLCRLFGAPITLFRTISCVVLFTASWQLAVMVRAPFEHRGGADEIHALKSGFVIPILMISLGLPLLFPATRRAERNAKPS